MRAIMADAAGQLHWRDVADPVPGPGEVLIAVAAAGVNRADLLQAAGKYPPPPGASDIIGLEVSGSVVAVDDDVAGFVAGQQVCALLAGGGYAEYVAVPAGQVMPLPPGVQLSDAAALPETACTVWSNLVSAAGLTAGEVLLVHGGASGIGTHAIQVARELGARVAVTAGSEAKLDLCRELGADITINYRDEDFVEQVRQATAGAGADVILDIMGASYLQRNLSALAADGRLVIIGLQGGLTAELNIGALIARRLSVFGTALRGRPVDGPHGKAVIVEQVVASVWPMIAAGRVRPVIGARLPMQQAGEAHRLLASGQTSGKILLTLPG
ncbi:MAG: NAD(P)H-quinone oxidoreductase [Mycobacterium sp.]|nr:NAD(P)H-quinone oxidoreductase [Mycobacterium sp.]